MKPIRVVQVVTDSNQTGAPSQVLFLLQGLKGKLDNHIICTEGWLTEEVRKSTDATIHLIDDNLSRDKQIKKIKSLYKVIQPDIIHCHGVRSTYVGRFAAADSVAKVVFTEHLWTNDFHLPQRFREIVQVAMMRRLSSRADVVIAVSEAVKAFLIKRRIVDKNKIRIVSGAILPQEQTALPLKNTIGTLGTLTFIKGTDVLLGAVAITKTTIPDIRCLIGGDGPDRKMLEKLAETLEIAQNVEFLGAQDGSKEFIKQLDCYIQASLSESFGMVILEAMSAGRPVIVNDAGGMPELVKDGGGLVFKKNSAESLAKNIIELLGDKKLTAKLSNEAAKIARKYDIKTMADKNLEIYQELMNK